MAATYDPAQVTARDRVRYLVGDTDVAAALLQDATYDALIAQHGEELATSVVAEGLAAQYARRPSSISGAQGSITWADRVKAWQAIATRFRVVAGTGGGGKTAGAIVLSRGDEAQSEYVSGVVITATIPWTG